jgi:hypothetical protein
VNGEPAGVGVVVDVHEDAVVDVCVKDGGNEIARQVPSRQELAIV